MNLAIENQDVLTEICLKLDDDSLFRFARTTQLWAEATRMLSSDLFWKRRVERAVGQPLTSSKCGIWMRAYYAILAMHAETEESSTGIIGYVYRAGLGDLDIFLILLQIRPTSSAEMEELLRIDGSEVSRSVFVWLMEQKLVTYDSDQQMVDQIDHLVYVDVVAEPEAAAVLVELMSADYMHQHWDECHALTVDLASVGYTNALIVLLDKYEYTNDDLVSLSIDAMNNDRNETAMMLLARAKLDEKQVDDLFDMVLERRPCPRLARLLIKLDPRKKDDIKASVLSDAIRVGDEDTVEFFLDYHSAKGAVRQALIAACRTGSSMLSIILSHPNVDPMQHITAVLEELSGDVTTARRVQRTSWVHPPPSVGSWTLDAIDALLLNPRVKVELFDWSTMRLLLWMLRTSPQVEVVAHLIEGESLYSLILRYVVLKRPSNDQLRAWMDSLNRDDVREATMATRRREWTAQHVSIQALLFRLLHPTMTEQDVLQSMRLSGVGEEAIALGLQLARIQLS